MGRSHLARATDLLGWLRSRSDDMAGLLERMAEIETPSRQPETITPLREMLAIELDEMAFRARRVAGRGVGDHLLARSRHAQPGRPRQLLLGHLDTVFPLGTIEKMPVVDDGVTLAGPGSYDMKSGLVQGLYALRALAEVGLDWAAEPVIFFNSDEEIGSPDSTRWVRALGRTSARVFVLEGSAGARGDLKTGRKGVGRFVVRAKGTAAHAGLDPESGVSAVLEISHQIQRLFELNDVDRGITVNVGTVDGGMRANVVAPEASAEVDARVLRVADARRVEAAIRGLEPVDPSVVLEVEGRFGRLPMEETPRNQALWRQAHEAATALGLDIDEATVGGASDGNTTSQLAATLDGLGGVGDGAHAAHEHIVLDTMPERAALLALLLAAPLDDIDHETAADRGGGA